jgi:hypothetical protein
LPAEEVYVFDACAVVALLQGEEGAPVASGLLLEESHRCLVHAINVRKPGRLKGRIHIAPDFDEPLPDEILTAFRGEGE